MKVLLIDNEPIALIALQDILEKNCPEISSISTASSVSEGKKSIEQFKPDIVFLDIELNNGTGFDLLNQLESYNFQLIFVTAFEKYALNAFKFSAIDFIHKPIETNAVVNALQKAMKFISYNDINIQISILKESLQKINNVDQKIVLKDNKTMHFILIKDIYHVMSDGPYTIFFTYDDKKIMVSKPLKDFESLLIPFGFIRTHHSHIVNKKRIVRLEKSEGNIFLDNGKLIPISQRKWETVIKLLEQS